MTLNNNFDNGYFVIKQSQTANVIKCHKKANGQWLMAKSKSFPFSALILLRRLFLLLARHSLQAASALASCVGSVFPLQAEIEKLIKFSVFRFPFSVIFIIFARNFVRK